MPTVKKPLLLVASILALITAQGHADTVTITLEAAQLQTSGSAAIPNGALIELLGDTSTTFGAPTASSFTGTDPNEAVLWSGTANSTTLGIAGSFRDAITITLDASGTAQGSLQSYVGADLLLRWYPTLTASSSTPGSGTTYGQFSTTAVENSSNIAWVVPSSGAYNLNFVTSNEGGSEPSSAGVANLVIGAIPEPGTLSLMAGAFALGVSVLRRRK